MKKNVLKQQIKLTHVLVGNYNCSELNLSVQTALEIIKTEELLKNRKLSRMYYFAFRENIIKHKY